MKTYDVTLDDSMWALAMLFMRVSLRTINSIVLPHIDILTNPDTKAEDKPPSGILMIAVNIFGSAINAFCEKITTAIGGLEELKEVEVTIPLSFEELMCMSTVSVLDAEQLELDPQKVLFAMVGKMHITMVIKKPLIQASMETLGKNITLEKGGDDGLRERIDTEPNL